MNMTEPEKRKRGRPKGSRNKRTLAKLAAAPKVVEAEIVPSVEENLVVAMSGGLDDEERQRFARLLAERMPLSERVDQLISLARLTDTKRAPVGLRAIQEINAITGVHDSKPAETPPMFVFPEDTQVSVHVEKVIK